MVYIINLTSNHKNNTKMEEKNLTERESLEIITTMIARTKERYIGDGNIMLMWGYLTVGMTALVWALLAITHDPNVNWLWFLMSMIGGIATPLMARKHQAKSRVKSYSDTVTSRIWTAVGLIAIAATVICLGFGLIAHVNAWNMMFAFALIIVPFAEMAQGIIVKEKCLVWGGAVGLLAGIFTVACFAGHVTLYAQWYFPMFMAVFIAMMIIPGHILNHKSRVERSESKK